jgi:hypothetical protein
MKVVVSSANEGSINEVILTKETRASLVSVTLGEITVTVRHHELEAALVAVRHSPH